MKTKFLGAPQGPEGKQARKQLRAWALTHLQALAHQVSRTEYRLLQIDRRYILPVGKNRGYVLCRFNEQESLRYYVSPGAKEESYIADKVEFWFHAGLTLTGLDRAVSLDITNQAWAQEFFYWMERTNRIRAEIYVARQAS